MIVRDAVNFESGAIGVAPGIMHGAERHDPAEPSAAYRSGGFGAGGANLDPILVFGAPRSGTTWLGKIFDSHPDVLYRHEPDLVQSDDGLPWVCPQPISAELRGMAADYLDRLIRTGTLKTSAIRPSFPKNYRGPLRGAARNGLVQAIRGLLALRVAPRRMDRFPIPDLVNKRPGKPWVVVKSVSAHGRAQAFALAAPQARVVVILRDPWGYVSSVMRGTAQGKFVSDAVLDWIPGSETGRRYGLTLAELTEMPVVERLAWNWAAMNEAFLDAFGDRPNARMIRYDLLCERPAPLAREIFDFVGLPWHRQTEAFIAQSTTFRGAERYYGVFRDASQAPHRWRHEMPLGDQRRVDAILQRTRLARYCPDLGSDVTQCPVSENSCMSGTGQ
ncbi:MAG: sulfotransferase [Rhodospirillales bacterium]|nr:sulfotransferase [Rhodospirillales bacterium]